MTVRGLTVVLAIVVLAGSATAQRGGDTTASEWRRIVVCKASGLTGCVVMDLRGQEIGEVEGLLVDPGTGRVGHLIVRTCGDHVKSRAVSIRKCRVKRGDRHQISVAVRGEDLEIATTVDRIEGARTWRARRVVGMNVEDANGERLGRIEALYVDPARRCVCYAAIGMGEVLGIGEKQHIIPYSVLHVRPNRNKAVVVVSRDALKKAPVYGREDLLPMNEAAWHVQVHRFYSAPVYWERGNRTLRASELEGAPVHVFGKAMTGRVKRVLLWSNGASVFLAVTGKTCPGQVSAVPLEDVYPIREGEERKLGVSARVLAESVRVPATDGKSPPAGRDTDAGGVGARSLQPAGAIFGRCVMNAAGQRIGEVKDLLLDPTRGQIDYAVMGLGDSPGIGRVLQLVPWRSLIVSGDRAYRLEATESDLRGALRFKPEEWNRIDQDWLDRTDDFYRALFTKP
jgi:sporulation protein YlmC with PRC-barrel domain